MRSRNGSMRMRFWGGCSSRCLRRRRVSAEVPRSRGAGWYFESRSAGQDGGGRLCGWTAPLAGLRVQPGVCGVSRVYAGGRSAACGLEFVCANGADVSEAVSGGDEQLSDGAAGCEQIDGVYFGQWGEVGGATTEQDGLCAVCGGVAVLSGDPQSAGWGGAALVWRWRTGG